MTREEIIKNLSGKLDDSTFKRIHTFFPIQKACPTCADKGEYTLYGKIYKCDCEIQSLLQKHYFAANIGREYHDICIKDFIGSDGEKVVSAVENYLADFDSKFHYGLGITFSGPVGTGKTFAMSSILKELIKEGRDAYLMSFEEMITTWASSWTDKEIKLQLETKLKSVDILGLDEIRTDNRSDAFLASGFDSIIRHRTSNLLPTIITTNMNEKEICKVFPKVHSLLSPRNQYVVLEGEDVRKDEVRFRIMELEANGERRPIC